MNDENKKLAFFQKIDEFLFKQVDALKVHPIYGKYREIMSSIPSELAPWVNQGLMFLILLLPIFMLLMLIASNVNYRELVARKEEIQHLSNKILKDQRELQQIQGQLIGFIPLKSQSELDIKIREAANLQKMDLTLLRIENFEVKTEGQLIITKYRLTYSKLSLPQLLHLLQTLTETQKMKVTSIQIKKNPTYELLEGSVDMSYYARESLQ